MTEPFRIAFEPGVMPDKWARTWRERTPDDPLEMVPLDDAHAALRDGHVHMALLRLPVDREGLHQIRLYVEQPVVVVPRDHPVTAYDEVALADLAGEQLIQDPAEVPGWEALDTPPRLDWPPMTVKDAIEVVASGGGIVVVPLSLARLHHRKDVAHRPVTDGPGSEVGLVWPVDDTDERLDRFVGIVRGRTARSTRGAATPPSPQPKQRTPRQKEPRTGGKRGTSLGRRPRGGRRGRR